MAIKVKAFITLEIDTDEYAVPSDGDVTDEIKEAMREYFHDITGIEIKGLRITQEKTYE